MKRFYVYIDASVIGGCEDSEFAEATLALWQLFIRGVYIMVLSEHTLRELQGAPQSVRNRLLEIPEAHQIILSDTAEGGYACRGVSIPRYCRPGQSIRCSSCGIGNNWPC